MLNETVVPGRTADIRIGTVIMHHPRRAERIPGLLRACAPLPAQVVADPEPDGIPSPLRTAKRAWAAVAPDATHHLVLQDDITLVSCFAQHLYRAVAARPRHAISLYSHWDSPQNSYLVRRAAMVGAPFAPLSRFEWTPTQGLVLPVDWARELAAYLADIPDEVKDDDEMVVNFCRERGIPVLATVPHLVDHRNDQTIVGHPGTFHASVFLPDPPLDVEHWRGSPLGEQRLAALCQDEPPRGYTVELRDSRCRIRFLRPGTGEPVEHHYGWYWRDWCALVGVDTGRLLDECASYLATRLAVPVAAGELDAGLLAEVWAAGYLLGADAATVAAEPAMLPHTRALLSRAAVASWMRCGLARRDLLAHTVEQRQVLVEVGLAAVVSSWVNRPTEPGR